MEGMTVWANDGFDMDNDYVWFVPFEKSILCRYDIKERVVNEIFELEEDWKCEEAVAYNVVLWEGTVIVIPARGENLYVIESDRIKKYNMSENGGKHEKYNCTVKTNNILYVFPIEEKSVIRISSGTVLKENFSYGTVTACDLLGEDIYFINNKNMLYKADLNLREISCLNILNDINLCGIKKFDDMLLLLTTEGKAFTLDVDHDNKLNEIVCLNNQDDYWSECCYVNKKIILFPQNDYTKIYVYDCIYQSMRIICVEKDDYFNIEWRYNSWGQPIEKNGHVYVMSPKHRAFFSIDSISESVKRYHMHLQIGKDKSYMILNKDLSVFSVAFENQYHSLETLLEYIK